MRNAGVREGSCPVEFQLDDFYFESLFLSCFIYSYGVVHCKHIAAVALVCWIISTRPPPFPAWFRRPRIDKLPMHLKILVGGHLSQASVLKSSFDAISMNRRYERKRLDNSNFTAKAINTTQVGGLKKKSSLNVNNTESMVADIVDTKHPATTSCTSEHCKFLLIYLFTIMCYRYKFNRFGGCLSKAKKAKARRKFGVRIFE